MSNVGAQEPHRGGRRRRRRVVRPPRVARAGDATAREVLAGVRGLQREAGGAQNHPEEDLSWRGSMNRTSTLRERHGVTPGIGGRQAGPCSRER